MENLVRLVDDSLVRHGCDVPVDHRRLPWSRWFRCESSFSMTLVPSLPGLYALAEEVIAPGELGDGRRMLAVLEIAESDDLAMTLARLFAPSSPRRDCLASGRCFVRYARVGSASERRAACASLQQWLTSAAENALGTTPDFTGQTIPIIFRTQPKPGDSPRTDEPPPLPAGF